MKPAIFQFLIIFFSVMLIANNKTNAQSEYRITDEGKYEYLSVREEAGMVFDESMGTYYKPITVRTFYLETQRKGFIPADLSYTDFLKMTVPQQRTILKQPYKDIQCSVDNPSAECMVAQKTAKAKVPALRNDPVYCNQGGYGPECKIVDLTPKCEVADLNKKTKSVSLTTQLITNPGGGNIKNSDCGDIIQQLEQTKGEDKSKVAPSTINVLLGKQ